MNAYIHPHTVYKQRTIGFTSSFKILFQNTDYMQSIIVCTFLSHTEVCSIVHGESDVPFRCAVSAV